MNVLKNRDSLLRSYTFLKTTTNAVRTIFPSKSCVSTCGMIISVGLLFLSFAPPPMASKQAPDQGIMLCMGKRRNKHILHLNTLHQCYSKVMVHGLLLAHDEFPGNKEINRSNYKIALEFHQE